MHKAYPMSIYCRCAIRESAHAAPSSALAKVGDGNIMSQSKYRSFGDELDQSSNSVSFSVRRHFFGVPAVCPVIFWNEVGMSPESAACAFDSDDDGVPSELRLRV